MTVKDSTGEIFVYGTYSADGEDRYSALSNKPVAGDVVLLYGTLVTFNGTREVKSGKIGKIGNRKFYFTVAGGTAKLAKSVIGKRLFETAEDAEKKGI